MKSKKKISLGSLLFDAVIYVGLLCLFVITFYPMWYVVVASFVLPTPSYTITLHVYSVFAVFPVTLYVAVPAVVVTVFSFVPFI